MSKGLVHFPDNQRLHVAARRLVGNTRGLGFWAAVGYHDKKGLSYPPQSNIGQQQTLKQAMERFENDGNSFHISEGSSPDQRHRGGVHKGGVSEGKSKRRGYRPTSSDNRNRNSRVGLPKMRRAIPEMGGGSQALRGDASPRSAGQSHGSRPQPRPGFQRGTDNGHYPVHPRRTGNQDQRTTGPRRSYSHASGGQKLGDFFPKDTKSGYAYRSRISGV